MSMTGIGGGWQTSGSGGTPTDSTTAIYDATASGTDTYTTPAITGVTSLFTGLKVAVKFTNANTTASTLQIGALAVTAIRKANIALVGGDITANTTYILEYDGTVFQQINDIDRPLYAVASGTNTYTATVSPVIGGYGTGYAFLIKFTNANTGASTLNLNTIGAVAIQKFGVALIGGDIIANGTYVLTYDGTNFQITSAQQRMNVNFGSAQASSVGAIVTESVVYSILIPAGTIETDDFLRLSVLWTTASTVDDKISRIYLHTSAGTVGLAPPVGSTQIAQFLVTTNSQSMPHTREYGVRTNTSIIQSSDGTTSYRDFIVVQTTAPTAITVPTFASDTYLIVTGQKETGTDSFRAEFVKLIISKT